MKERHLGQSDVSVVGLGSMGNTIADLYLKRGDRVTIWNRSPNRAAKLLERGALAAPDFASALSASPLTVMCVSNDAAVTELLQSAGVDDAIAGRTLIQLTTVAPTTARDGENWARANGAAYLAGAIQAAPSQMGQPDTPLFICGDEGTWQAQRERLATLAGGLVYLGADPGAAATMDLATLSWVYGSMLGFLQGALIAQAERVDVASYGALVRRIAPSFGAFFEHEASVIQSADFTISESPMRISIDATNRLLELAQRSGISTEFPAFVASLFGRAARAGLGNEEVAALIKVMRASSTLPGGALLS